jgi:hypothetical protein
MQVTGLTLDVVADSGTQYRVTALPNDQNYWTMSLLQSVGMRPAYYSTRIEAQTPEKLLEDAKRWIQNCEDEHAQMLAVISAAAA